MNLFRRILTSLASRGEDDSTEYADELRWRGCRINADAHWCDEPTQLLRRFPR